MSDITDRIQPVHVLPEQDSSDTFQHHLHGECPCIPAVEQIEVDGERCWRVIHNPSGVW